MTYFHTLRTCIATAIWVATLGILLYHYSQLCQSTNHTDQLEGQLKKGRLNKINYDSSDFEWRLFKKIFYLYWHVFLAHFCFSTTLLLLDLPKCRIVSWILLSLFALQHIISTSALILIVVNVLILLLLAVLGKNILSYALCFGVFIASQSTNIATRIADESDAKLNYNMLNFEEKRFLFTTCICILNAKGLSCCLDNLTIKQKKKLGSGRGKFYEKLLNMTAYLLYLPGLFLGPVYLFNDFEKALNKFNNEKEVFPLTSKSFLVKFHIIGCKFICLEYALHSLHSTAASQNTALVASYDVWQYSGFVVSTCFLYILKMGCIYGSFKLWECLDGMGTLSEQLPLYNESVHLASQIWRYTNPNMYKWLREYISKPIVGTVPNKYGLIAAAILSFCSLSFLHPTNSLSLTIWLLIGILCSTIETWAVVIGFAFDWESKIKANLSTSFYTALMAYVCLPVFALSLVSNLFYVTENFELALDLKMRLTDGFNLSYLTFLFVTLYSGTYVIIEATRCKSLFKYYGYTQKRH